VYEPHAATSQGLVQILPAYRVAGQQNTLYIVTLPNRYPSPSTQALIDYLRDAILSLAKTWE
jgi:DNA-binding transcriptional LysR family regulator